MQPNNFLLAVVEVFKCLQVVYILNRGRLSAENRVIPSIQLVLQGGSLAVFAQSGRSCPALKSDIVDLLVVVLHERVLSFAERREHRDSGNFEWTVDLESPVLHHVGQGSILLFHGARPLNVGYFTGHELFSCDTLFALGLLAVASLLLSVLKLHVQILTLLSCCPLLYLKIVACFFKVFQPKVKFLHICSHANLLVSSWACSWLPELCRVWPQPQQGLCIELFSHKTV